MITVIDDQPIRGLVDDEVRQRLAQYGPNEVPEERPRRFLMFVKKMWGFVPWMLEATILLQLLLGKGVQALITLLLLLVNAVISFVQESSAQKSLELLQKRLTIQARVLRHGEWRLLAARELVPGDIVRLRVGDMVPADITLNSGQLGADNSALTGESLLTEIKAGETVYAASMIKRGEGIGTVTATGGHTFFGRTARLVQTAKSISHAELTIQEIVKYLLILNAVLVVGMLIYSLVAHLPAEEILPFTLILLVASIPVALPATFTLATAVGAQNLVHRGVLTTRLSAIKEAASMDILCSDKTGTITRNELAVIETFTYPPYSEMDVLRWAALASDPATHDPIDLAIIAAAKTHSVNLADVQRTQFIPFDPSTKRTEAVVRDGLETQHIVKGMPEIVGTLTAQDFPAADVTKLASQGYRVIAIAVGPEQGVLDRVGLIALQDPPRDDSAQVIQQLRALGVQVVMITGDGLETARAIAAQVGITGKAGSVNDLRNGLNVAKLDYEVFSGVFPEDKFQLVQKLQTAGHIVGMTGDGVNDAPALRQAELGAAVANATDVAKSAAGVILLNPGLSDILATVEVGRHIYQRMLTYTLNKVVKTFQVALFLSIGLIVTGVLVTRPTLILLLLLANDFVTMSLTTDNVRASSRPDQWNVRALVISGLVLAAGWLLVSFAVLFVGYNILALPLDQLQTLIFLMLVFTGQANVYLIRERRHFWQSLPSRWLLLSTTCDLLAVCVLSIRGILMVPINPLLVVILLVFVIGAMIPLDFAKVKIFQKFGLVVK